jgi:hypothetical protein
MACKKEGATDEQWAATSLHILKVIECEDGRGRLKAQVKTPDD